MNFFQRFEKGMRYIFPSTFTLAIGLTVITFILALVLTNPGENALVDPLSSSSNHMIKLLGYWYNGLWQTGMLAFAIQMMLILVLGYVLASTRFFQMFIDKVLVYCNSTAKAAFLVTFFTLILSLFNWGLGLIFGSHFCKKGWRTCSKNGICTELSGSCGCRLFRIDGLARWYFRIRSPESGRAGTSGFLNRYESGPA